MIISASRRTDIPACYSDWFFNRLQEGYVCVRNPMNFHQISKISLSPEVVDGFVFWTKDPRPMMERLEELNDYPFYFQFTLTPYGRDVEANLPSKNDVLIPTFRELSEKIGPERVIWRYDPILLTGKYDIGYHVHYFEQMAKRLSGHTEKCIISFLDIYRNTRNNLKDLLPMSSRKMQEIAGRLAQIAAQYGMKMETCSELIDLEQFGVAHGHCINRELLERISGCKLELSRDKNQRKECGCMESIDIGTYNTCKNGCRYCYANYNAGMIPRNIAAHDSASPLLCGGIMEDDVVKERAMRSNRVRSIADCGEQMEVFSLFDL